jgi:hypothetical protein
MSLVGYTFPREKTNKFWPNSDPNGWDERKAAQQNASGIYQILKRIFCLPGMEKIPGSSPSKISIWKGNVMMPQRSIEYLTGFLMGVSLGFSLEVGLVSAYNLLANWLGWVLLQLTWWMLIPLPLLVGFVVSKAIASLHLEDY